MFPDHLIRKLTVPINKSCYLIFFCYNFFDKAEVTNMYEIKSRRHFPNINLFYFSSFILKKVTLQKKLDCIDKDDIGDFQDSPRLVFIDEECGNLTAVKDGRELARNINQKKNFDILQYPKDVHSVRNFVGESIYSVG